MFSVMLPSALHMPPSPPGMSSLYLHQKNKQSDEIYKVSILFPDHDVSSFLATLLYGMKLCLKHL